VPVTWHTPGEGGIMAVFCHGRTPLVRREGARTLQDRGAHNAPLINRQDSSLGGSY